MRSALCPIQDKLPGEGVFHSVDTHSYFFREGIHSEAQIASLLGLECGDQQPFPGVWYVTQRDGQSILEIAYVVSHTTEGCLFAVLNSSTKTIVAATQVADSTHLDDWRNE